MAKTVGAIVNAALKEVGDAEIVEFAATNILHQQMIEEMNNRVRRVRARFRARWALTRGTLQLTAPITTGQVTVTQGSATISSKDSSGSAAENFGSVAAGMKIIVGSDTTAYKITAVSTSSSPDNITIDGNYTGATATTSYTIFKDTYSMSGLTDFDEIIMANYGDGGNWIGNISGQGPNYSIDIVALQTIMAATGGNLYRNTSGKPTMMAQIEGDSSGNTQFLVNPYPDDDYYLELWYVKKFTENSTFSSDLFDGDAPEEAYDYVEQGVLARASRYDENDAGTQYWEVRATDTLRDLTARENRSNQDDNQLEVQTYRQGSAGTIEGRSQVAFDNKRAWRS